MTRDSKMTSTASAGPPFARHVEISVGRRSRTGLGYRTLISASLSHPTTATTRLRVGLVFGRQQFDGKQQSHGPAAVVAAVNGRAIEIVLQRLLLACAGADVDQFAALARAFFDRPPGTLDAGMILGFVDPAAADRPLHRPANHGRAGILVVARRL